MKPEMAVMRKMRKMGEEKAIEDENYLDTLGVMEIEKVELNLVKCLLLRACMTAEIEILVVCGISGCSPF